MPEVAVRHSRIMLTAVSEADEVVEVTEQKEEEELTMVEVMVEGVDSVGDDGRSGSC